MLYLKEEFIYKLMKCQWFENCGSDKPEAFDFNVKYVKSSDKAKKHLASKKWDNHCLNMKGDFTEYMFVNHNEIYNKWNTIFGQLKDEYLNSLYEKIKVSANSIKLDSAFPILWYNILTLCMINVYSDYYNDGFHDKMLQIFLSGHIPCGWEGTKKEGLFLVY